MKTNMLLALLFVIIALQHASAAPLNMKFNKGMILESDDLNKMVDSINELYRNGGEFTATGAVTVTATQAPTTIVMPTEWPSVWAFCLAAVAAFISVCSAVISNIKLWRIEKQVYLALAEVIVERRKP